MRRSHPKDSTLTYVFPATSKILCLMFLSAGVSGITKDKLSINDQYRVSPNCASYRKQTSEVQKCWRNSWRTYAASALWTRQRIWQFSLSTPSFFRPSVKIPPFVTFPIWSVVAVLGAPSLFTISFAVFYVERFRILSLPIFIAVKTCIC